MEKKIMIIFVFNLVSLLGFSQSNYNDYTKKDTIGIFLDEFVTTEKNWNIRDNKYTMLQLSDSQLLLKSKDRRPSRGEQDIKINTSKDFEIETKLKILSINNPKDGHYMLWGANDKGNFMIGFNLKNEYTIFKWNDKQRKDHKITDFVNFTYSSYINKDDYNKLTIRKVGDYYYYFINENFIYKMPFEKFFQSTSRSSLPAAPRQKIPRQKK